MNDDFILSMQRLAREAGEGEFRTRALVMLRNVISFETGSWGTTQPDGAGVTLSNVQLLGQTEALLQSYIAVQSHDRIGRKTIEHPGRTQTMAWGDYNGTSEVFRNYCERFEHCNILSTMSKGSLGSQHNFVTLARGKAAAPFDEGEKARMEQLLPHLLDAWILNRSWHMPAAPKSDQPGSMFSGICSVTGELLGDYPQFAQLIGNAFPGWSPPQLPRSFMAALERQGFWRWKQLLVQTYPVAEIVFLTARVTTEIDKLTAREMTIARVAAQGLSYKEIARSLGLSPATVRAHLHNIYGKLEISNKTALSRAISTTTSTEFGAADDAQVQIRAVQ